MCRYEHPVKGQGIYAYVTLMQDTEYSPELKKELVKTVRGHIGAFAAPDVIHWAPGRLSPKLFLQGKGSLKTYVPYVHHFFAKYLVARIF